MSDKDIRADHADRPTVMYHATSPSHRESILRHGLQRRFSETAQVAKGEVDWELAGGIFFSTKTKDEKANQGCDVWEVDVRGLSLEPDDTTDVPYPEDGGIEGDEWWVTYNEDVPPSRLKLFKPGDPSFLPRPAPMKVSLIAGLPGSGKTTLLKEMAAQGAVTIDDITDLASLPTSPVPWLAIADVNFCIPEVRDNVGVELRQRYGRDVHIEWTFFANDPAQCLKNAEARNDGRNVRPDIEVLSRRYVIPNGQPTRMVHGATADTERQRKLVDAVTAWHMGYRKDDAWTGRDSRKQNGILALAKGLEVSYDGMLYRGTAIDDEDFVRLRNGEDVPFKLRPTGKIVSWSKDEEIADRFAQDAWDGGDAMCAIVIALPARDMVLVADLEAISEDIDGEREVISMNGEIVLNSSNVVRMYAYNELEAEASANTP